MLANVALEEHSMQFTCFLKCVECIVKSNISFLLPKIKSLYLIVKSMINTSLSASLNK